MTSKEHCLYRLCEKANHLPFRSLSVSRERRAPPVLHISLLQPTHTGLAWAGLGLSFCKKEIRLLPQHPLRAPVPWSPWSPGAEGKVVPLTRFLVPQEGVPSSTHCLTRWGAPAMLQGKTGAKDSQPAHPAAAKEWVAQSLALWKRVPPATDKDESPSHSTI